MGRVACNLNYQKLEGARWSESWRIQANLVAKPLRSNDGDFVTYSLVDFKVEGEFWVVAFDDGLGRLLDGLSGGGHQYCSNW